MNTSLNFSQKTNFIAGTSKFPNLEFYLQSATLPGINLEIQKATYQGLDGFLASDTRAFSDLSFDVLIDEDFEIYKMFFNEITASKAITNSTYAQREFDFYVQVYNNKGRLIFTEYFRNCLLESIGEVSLNTTEVDVVNTFNCAIKFDYAEIEYNQQYDG